MRPDSMSTNATVTTPTLAPLSKKKLKALLATKMTLAQRIPRHAADTTEPLWHIAKDINDPRADVYGHCGTIPNDTPRRHVTLKDLLSMLVCDSRGVFRGDVLCEYCLREFLNSLNLAFTRNASTGTWSITGVITTTTPAPKEPKVKTTVLTRAMNSQLKKLGKDKATIEAKQTRLATKRDALQRELNQTKNDIDAVCKEHVAISKRLTTLRTAMDSELAAANAKNPATMRECGACRGTGVGMWSDQPNCSLCGGSGTLSINKFGPGDNVVEKMFKKAIDRPFAGITCKQYR